MIQVHVDEQAVEQLYLQAINNRLDEIDKKLVFWDSSDLKRCTRMSWNTIQDNFFHEPDFPKVKVGGKWYFPAKETEEFLNKWLKERRSNK